MESQDQRYETYRFRISELGYLRYLCLGPIFTRYSRFLYFLGFLLFYQIDVYSFLGLELKCFTAPSISMKHNMTTSAPVAACHLNKSSTGIICPETEMQERVTF